MSASRIRAALLIVASMIMGAPSIALSQLSHFLFLPFDDPDVVLQQGWLYNFQGPFKCSLPEGPFKCPLPEGNLCHRAIDYRKGQADPSTWVSFPVLAAASGRAVATKSESYGNLVYIAHNAFDVQNLRFYTLYGHLASNAQGIPKKDMKDVRSNIANGDFTSWAEIKAGDEIGAAGKTGLSNNVIHLHFEVHRDGWAQNKTDPYDIYDTRCAYPMPCGPDFLWTQCPPVFPMAGISLVDRIQVAPYPYPIGIGVSPNGSSLYIVVANPFSSPRRASVSIVNAAAPSPVAPSFSLDPGTVEQLAPSPDGRRIYIASDGHVEAFDFIENILRSIPTTSSSLDASDVAVSGDNTTVYVSNRSSNSVSVITVNPTNLMGSVSVAPVPTVSETYGMALTPDGARLYTVSRTNGRVGVIATPSTQLPSFQTSIGASLSTTQIAISSDGRRGYIVDGITNKISVIDTEPGSMTRDSEIAVIQPEQGTKYIDVVVSPSGNSVLVTAANPGKLLLVDVTNPAAFKATRVLSLVDIAAPGFIALGKGPSSGFAFVTSGGGSDPNSHIAIVQLNF